VPFPMKNISNYLYGCKLFVGHLHSLRVLSFVQFSLDRKPCFRFFMLAIRLIITSWLIKVSLRLFMVIKENSRCSILFHLRFLGDNDRLESECRFH
jgi:hypothetical protein